MFLLDLYLVFSLHIIMIFLLQIIDFVAHGEIWVS